VDTISHLHALCYIQLMHLRVKFAHQLAHSTWPLAYLNFSRHYQYWSIANPSIPTTLSSPFFFLAYFDGHGGH
jgi:hypothetical protein